jgi:DNA polymerase-3 subunit gamma/tau
VVAALYRRYRPETFAELIGQSQVTDPLRTALRTDRVNHAYLFSGPRGCGKTTSARILARCLNCAEGPTDTPCGVCPSCVELSREGSGSLDVVEIDAASHNGVDDARDLRERAVFAPARDRFKIFILDEAHMVTSQGFNALLKIVEEPPEHVKFIFATTEPEKVLGTIRSRTHHYPFRLVPPAQMLDYVQQLCESEGVKVDAGVLPLVVRAGGGSVRDTLSLLDQLIAGSESAADDSVTVEYERAVALLGYTHGALLDEVIDAIGSRDAGAVFAGVDRVIQTGQDPRRFVEDLLERLRDLIIVAATSGNAHAVLRGIPQDQLDTMSAQATMFGTTELSRAADVVNSALSEMTGATSPRLHLELMVARILVPASDDTERGALARVERLERRIGVEGDSAPRASRVEPPASLVEPPASLVEPVETPPPSNPERPSNPEPASEVEPTSPVEPTSVVEPVETVTPAEPTVAVASAPSTVTLQLVRDSWPEILEVIEKAKRTAWMVVVTAKPIEWREGNVLVLSFPSQNDVAALKQQSTPGDGVGDHLKKAMLQVLGIEPLLIARVAESPVGADRPAPASPSPAAAPAPAVDAAGWAVAAIPESSDPEPEPDSSAQSSAPTSSAQTTSPASSAQTTSLVEPVETPAPPPSAPTARPQSPNASRRYGESVVREILGASFIEEETLKPRVIPQPRDE